MRSRPLFLLVLTAVTLISFFAGWTEPSQPVTASDTPSEQPVPPLTKPVLASPEQKHSATDKGASHPVPPESEKNSAQIAGNSQTALNTLPKTEQESLWAALGSARRAVQPLTDHEASLPQNKGVRYFAQNPAQHLTMRFLDGSVRIESGRGGKWAATLGLDTRTRPQPNLTNDRVEYHHANGITEWYENRADGIEHAFKVARRLGSTSGELRVPVSLQGVQAQPGEGPQAGSLTFTDTTSGAPVLSYGALKVWDARGKELAAHYETKPTGLDIVVADAGAVYPVTVDPLIVSLEQKLGPDFTGDGQAESRFGYAVALDGNTALIGVPEYESTAGKSGCAFIFVRNGSIWSRQALLMPSVSVTDQSFGKSVALSGNTALVGAEGDRVNNYATGSAFIFVRTGTTWSQQARLTSPDVVGLDKLGASVALSGDTALVAAVEDDKETAQAIIEDVGSVYVFVRSGAVWSQQAKLNPYDTVFQHDQFGYSVSLSGDTAVASTHSSEERVYVFVRNGTTWTQQARLSGDDAFFGEDFGYSVAVSGNTALVGAPATPDPVNDNHDTGAVYVFIRSGTDWSRQAKLAANDPVRYGRFGQGVALSGETSLIGGIGGGDGLHNEGGCAYVFTRSGIVWSQQAKLSFGTLDPMDNFGRAVALSGDTALVGAPDDDTAAGRESGSAHIFTRHGTTWSQQAQPSIGEDSSYENFGVSVALSGNTALIGAIGDHSASGIQTGSVYVITRSGTVWTLQTKLVPDGPPSVTGFGESVALQADTALVGAPQGIDSMGYYTGGNAFVFTRSGTLWSQQAILAASDTEAGDNFGASVTVSGNTAVVGANHDDTEVGYEAGSAYVFTRSGAIWSQQAKLTGSQSRSSNYFGKSVSLSGDSVLVGSWYDAYVYKRDGTVWNEQARFTASGDMTLGDTVSLSGDTALVGACDDSTPGNTGCAYVFVRSGTAWTQQAQLLGTYFGEGTGFSVALSGNTAVLSALGYEQAYRGYVRVFTRKGTAWTERDLFEADDTAERDYFGEALALDGDTVLVGAFGNDSLSAVTGAPRTDHGSVYVLRLPPNEPTLTISGKGRAITTGDATPSATDDTHFGITPAGGSIITHTFTMTNPGTGDLTLTGAPYVSLEGSSAFRVMQQPASATLATGGAQTFQIRFYPTTGGEHTAVVTIASDDENASPFTMTVRGGRAVAASIITQPTSRLVPLGSPASLSVVAGGYPAPPVQWRKETTAIPGATGNSFVIPVTKATDAGTYSAVVNTSSISPLTSESVYLGLVTQSPGTQVLKTGGALKLACTAIGPKTPGVKLTYRWQRGEAALSDGTMLNGAVVKGAADTVLTLTKIGVEDAGIYTCLVTMETPGIPATHANAPKTTNGNTTVHVVGGIPDVDAIPAATISVSQPVNMTITATNFPTGFSVSGLPAGLKFDGKTGRLTGKPTSPSKKDKNGAYTPNKLSFKASNPVGTSTAEDFYLTIQELDRGAIGTFNGIVARSAHSNFGMGGHLQITVASTGIVSGSATLAGQKHSILGSLDASTDSDPTGELIIKRSPASLGDLKLTLSIDTEKDLLQGTIEDPQFKMLEGSIDLGNPNEPGLMDGAVDAARFDSPSGIALRPDASGYIADTGNHVIRLVNSVTQEVSTYAGSGVAGFVDGDGEAASFNSPGGLALDTAGNLYVADTGNATIRKISPAGTVTTFAGTAGQFGSTDGIGTSARFSQPCALCLDPAGNLYVADRGSHLIRKITPTSVVTTLAGRANAPGHKDGSGTGAQFKAPGGITYDPVLKALFVADTQNRVIRKVTLAGATTTYAGSPGVSGDDDGLFANVRFMAPVGITSLGDGRLVVADTLLVQLNPNGTAGTVSESLPGLNQADHPVALACNANEQSLIVVHDTLHAVFGYEPGEPLGDGLVEARRNTWSNASLVPPQLQGIYNAAIETTAAVGDVEYPQGDGYAQVSVDKMGVAKWTGVAADGSTFTFSTFMAANHSIPLHAMLYRNTGSLQGECRISTTTLDIINSDTHAFDWCKIAQPLASTDRSYKAGFLRHGLNLTGGRHTPNNVFSYLGLAGASANMQLTFSASRIPQFLQPFILTAPNKVSVGSPVNSLTLKLDPKTGTFTGSFKESTAGVTVPFAGMLIDYEAGPVRRGHGHYLIPDSASNTSPIQSRRVRLERVVAP